MTFDKWVKTLDQDDEMYFRRADARIGWDAAKADSAHEIERLRASESSAWGAFVSRDQEIEDLQKHVAACNIANIRLATELSTAKALLREAVATLRTLEWEEGDNVHHLLRRIRTALGDKP